MNEEKNYAQCKCEICIFFSSRWGYNNEFICFYNCDWLFCVMKCLWNCLKGSWNHGKSKLWMVTCKYRLNDACKSGDQCAFVHQLSLLIAGNRYWNPMHSPEI